MVHSSSNKRPWLLTVRR